MSTFSTCGFLNIVIYYLALAVDVLAVVSVSRAAAIFANNVLLLIELLTFISFSLSVVIFRNYVHWQSLLLMTLCLSCIFKRSWHWNQ